MRVSTLTLTLGLALVLTACRSPSVSVGDAGPTPDPPPPAPAAVAPPPSTTATEVTPKETAMLPASDDVLPSALGPEQLDQVELVYSFISPKTGAGRQEIHIKGTGAVQLLRTMAYDHPEQTIDAQAPRDATHRMLDVIEDGGFFALEDVYEQEPPHGGRLIIRVTLPGGHVKQVAVDVVPDHRPPHGFERAVGAIKLVAGLSTPEALHHRFLSTL